MTGKTQTPCSSSLMHSNHTVLSVQSNCSKLQRILKTLWLSPRIMNRKYGGKNPSKTGGNKARRHFSLFLLTAGWSCTLASRSRESMCPYSWCSFTVIGFNHVMKLLWKETSRDSNIEISKSCHQVPYSGLGINFFFTWTFLPKTENRFKTRLTRFKASKENQIPIESESKRCLLWRLSIQKNNVSFR